MTDVAGSIANWTPATTGQPTDAIMIRRGATNPPEMLLPLSVLDTRYQPLVDEPGENIVFGTDNQGNVTTVTPGTGLALAGGNLVANGADHAGYQQLGALDMNAKLVVVTANGSALLPVIMMLNLTFGMARATMSPLSGTIIAPNGTQILDITSDIAITSLSFASAPIAGAIYLVFRAGGSIGGVTVGAGGVVQLIASEDGSEWLVGAHS